MQYFNLGGGTSIKIAASTAPSVSSYDPDAQLFFDAQATAGVTLSVIEMDAVNQLVLDMKTAGIWTKMLAIYPFVGNTATSHKWNLKDPRDLDIAYRLQFFGGMAHNSDGIQGNAINSYADTFLGHNLTRTTGGVSTYLLDNIAQNSAAIRVDSGASVITQILPRWSDGTSYFRAYTTSSISIPNSDSKGFYAVSRISNNQVIVNFKGSNNTYVNTLAAINTDRSYYIMAGHSTLNTAEAIGSRKIAFTTIHNDMDGTDLLNLYAAVQTFQTALGRQV